MSSDRLAFVSVLILGIAAALAFHSSGALSERDALSIAAFEGGVTTSPPGPVSTRLLVAGAELIRVVWAPTGIFRATHLAASFWLALAAALSALVAFRAGESEGGRWAAAILVGGGVLFGGELGGLGRQAGPIAVLVLLLAGSAAAWTAARPRAALGGVLLGLALAEHPLVLFFLPGFGAMALGATLRLPAERGGAFLARAWSGALVGAAALLLIIHDGRQPGLLAVGDPDSIAGAIAVWWGGSSPTWVAAGPGAWAGGVVECMTALWRNAGPLGLVLGFAGLLSFFHGRARLVRPFMITHAVLALAAILGTLGDADVASALLGWSFLFWGIPTLASMDQRLTATGAALTRTPAASVLAVALLLAANYAVLNRSSEKGVAWASTILETAPPDAVFLTRNPVQLALAADGLREDVDLVYLPHASSLEANRSGRGLLPIDAAPDLTRPIDGPTLQSLLTTNVGLRPVLADPSVSFADDAPELVLSNRWEFGAFGLASLVRARGGQTSNADAGVSMFAWEDVHVTPDTPASDLRGGLTGSEYFARSLLNSAQQFLAEGRDLDAERDFLLTLGHPDADHAAAAMGLAQIMFQRRLYREAIQTLDDHVPDDDPHARVAYRVRASAYLRLRDLERARFCTQRALDLTPSSMINEVNELRSALERFSAGS